MITTLITDGSNAPTSIVRNLSDGSQYSPDWRYHVVEEQLVSVRENGQSKIREFLEKEKDPYVRALILFHACRPTKLQKQLAYALGCNREKATTGIAGMIKAMVIANQTPQQIAEQIGTSSKNVTAFERIFFDVRPYLSRRVWLRTICFPALYPSAPRDRRAEVRYMQIAFLHGWSGLYRLICPPCSKSAKCHPQGFIASLQMRAGDYVYLLEQYGIPPSERDLQRLDVGSRAVAALRLPITATDLAFEEPLEPDLKKKSAHWHAPKLFHPKVVDACRWPGE